MNERLLQSLGSSLYALIFRKCLYMGDCKGKLRKYSYTNKRDRVE